MATTNPSSSVGKKTPKWYLTDEELINSPSRKAGMDAVTELKCRREAAEFIQEMAERLNHNVPQNRGQINQNCICIAMVHMHRFFVVHPFTMFAPKDVAAACLFLAGKSEECPRKLEHIVEVWFKLKHRKAEAQPPFNETVKKSGSELITFYEGILLQTIGFDLHVGLPHPIVIQNMGKFKLDNKKLINCAYWFATDIIQLTNWCIRYNERTIACVCIYIACSWADYEIPENAGTPWFKQIDSEMTEELLNKLTDEFTLVYKECSDCHARRFIQKAKNGNPSTMPAKSIAQLPPPPAPPVLATKKAENNAIEQHDAKRPSSAAAASTLKRPPVKRSPPAEPGEQPAKAAKILATTSSRVESPSKNAKTPKSPNLPSTTGDQTKIPQVKQEAVSPTPPTSTAANDKPMEKRPEEVKTDKKKIGLSEYKQRLKVIKQEPSDSPASQSTPTTNTGNNADLKTDGGTAIPSTVGDNEEKGKRISFMPDLSNASSSTIGVEALPLPVGIPLVEKRKEPSKQQSDRTGEKQQNPTSSANRSHHHHREFNERSHHQNYKEKERQHKNHYREKERGSTKIYLNGVSSSEERERHKHRHGHERSSSKERGHYEKQKQRDLMKREPLEPPPLPPTSFSPNGQPPPPPPLPHELEEGEVE